MLFSHLVHCVLFGVVLCWHGGCSTGGWRAKRTAGVMNMLVVKGSGDGWVQWCRDIGRSSLNHHSSPSHQPYTPPTSPPPPPLHPSHPLSTPHHHSPLPTPPRALDLPHQLSNPHQPSTPHVTTPTISPLSPALHPPPALHRGRI